MAGSAAEPESYEYDEVGNRTVSHLSLTHVVNAANRLTEDDQACYGYDANGNLQTRTEKIAGACTGGVTTYTYDAQDQLIQIDFAAGGSAAYAYDALGRRIRKNVDGVVTVYVYDGPDILLEFDGTGTLQARYGHGNRVDQPLTMARDLDGSGSFEASESFYYHADHQGSVLFLTDAAGFVTNEYAYDAYGRPVTLMETVDNPYLFTAREYDPESGLYHSRARAYDPDTGRFLQQDPLGFGAGDLNLYRYVLNDPVNLTDPDGRFYQHIVFVVARQGGRYAGRQAARAFIRWCITSPSCTSRVTEAVRDFREMLEEWTDSHKDRPADEGAGNEAGKGGENESTDDTGSGSLDEPCNDGGASGGGGGGGNNTNDVSPPPDDPGDGNGDGLNQNPFKGKSSAEIDQMLRNKGYQPKGPDPQAGRGSYVNPNTGRSYHIDSAHPAPKGPHVGVSRPRGPARKFLPTRDFPM
jgi:RHS repeat-associated protein